MSGKRGSIIRALIKQCLDEIMLIDAIKTEECDRVICEQKGQKRK
jgi:hypothetical protein